MFKAIIIDDELNGIILLQHLIEENCPAVSVIGTETSAKKAIQLIEKHKPDVVFLDIEMPEMSGFEMLEHLKHLSFYVIFTTAFGDYALRAFKYNTIDYLMKPVIVEELVAAVGKLQANRKSENDILTIDQLLKAIRQAQQQGKLAINSLNEILFVEKDDIIRFEADQNYTNVILVGGKKIVSTKTLKTFGELLEPEKFFRTHKAHIINLDHVQKYVKADGGFIVTKDNAQIPISREKRSELMSLLSLR